MLKSYYFFVRLRVKLHTINGINCKENFVLEIKCETTYVPFVRHKCEKPLSKTYITNSFVVLTEYKKG